MAACPPPSVSEEGQVYSVCIMYFSCFTISTPLCSQNINKQIVNIADENIRNYSFLNKYHHTKSKNYFKRQNQIRHWIPMFIGTPCIYNFGQKLLKKVIFINLSTFIFVNSLFKIIILFEQNIPHEKNREIPLWKVKRNKKNKKYRLQGLHLGIPNSQF